jgi:hypothetical protein
MRTKTLLPLLTILFALLAAVPANAVTGKVASFENSDYSEVDGFGTYNGVTLSFTTERAYEGSRSLKLVYDGSLGNPYGRTQWNVNWSNGSDVWYGGAFYVADPSKLRYTDLIRWDNYLSYGSAGDVGGLLAENGQLRVQKRYYNGTASAALTPSVAIPAGRWFWVEVHQKLSDVPGQALTALYLDGALVGSSTSPNSSGRVINHIRYGHVYNYDGGGAHTMLMDRPSWSNTQRGPLF